MESISRTLLPYKEIVGTLASYLTIAQFFSGVFICNDIRKRRHTRGISAVPFIGGITMGVAMLKYGLILKDEVMFTVNVAAIALNTIYAIYYYIYSRNKWDEFLKPLALGTAIAAILWGYCEWEDKTKVEFRYGLIVTVLMLLLLGTPLFGLQEIISKKDASQIPFVLTLMGTIVTFFWLLYGIILLNNFMIVQNVIGFILCFVQLVLIFVYPGKPTTKSSKKKKTN